MTNFSDPIHKVAPLRSVVICRKVEGERRQWVAELDCGHVIPWKKHYPGETEWKPDAQRIRCTQCFEETGKSVEEELEKLEKAELEKPEVELAPLVPIVEYTFEDDASISVELECGHKVRQWVPDWLYDKLKRARKLAPNKPRRKRCEECLKAASGSSSMNET